MAEILHPFLTKFRQILWGNIDQYFFEKECFRSSYGGADLIWAVLILGVRLEEILREKLTAERGAAATAG